MGSGGCERLPDLVKQMSVGGGQQAVVTDFDEAFGQDVLKEAADKLFGGDGRESGPIYGRVLVGECDLAIFEREDAAIADGCPFGRMVSALVKPVPTPFCRRGTFHRSASRSARAFRNGARDRYKQSGRSSTWMRSSSKCATKGRSSRRRSTSRLESI